MKRLNIDYGIDLGTTNSALARIDSGALTIIKSLDDQRDTTPSTVAYNKKGAQQVGASSSQVYRQECLKSMKRAIPFNAYIEFKRTMGTDERYESSHKGESFSSEQLSAEVLKYLKGYVSDEKIDAAVITIPAAYTMNQIDAVRRAADLAGFKYIETLQEPVAAAMAYGVEGKGKDGFWLVFDFGGGTFDAALVKVEDGIVKVIDSSGDNHLGGKDLDFAVVDKLIIPHIQENFEIDELLSDPNVSSNFRAGLKFFAEQLKNQLSFNDEYELCIDAGDIRDDDDGEEIDIDLTVTQATLRAVVETVYQRAIDLSLDLLKRNNLSGEQLASLILVGGPTLSPVLRDMVGEQICAPDTSVDPMTVVARGAAIYASTVSLPEDIVDAKRDRTKVQLGVDYEASSVELTEFITLKVLTNKTEGTIPDQVYAQLSRNDGAWKSDKVEIDARGEVCDVELVDGKTNSFDIALFDGEGNQVECEPTSFSIIQGSVLGSMPLPLHFGVEILDISNGDLVFSALKGLEKNATLPATGICKRELKTQKDIRPGIQADFIKIPLYQGEHYAEGSRAIHNEHVYDVLISGSDLPKLLPAGSTVELMVSVDRSQNIKVEAYFSYLDYTYEIDLPTSDVQSISTDVLEKEFVKASSVISELDDSASLHARLEEAERELNASSDCVDAKMKARDELRSVLKEIDRLNKSEAWPNMERKLKHEFKRLEDANSDLGNEDTTEHVDSIRDELSDVLQSQDLKAGKQLLQTISSLFFQLTKLYQFMGFIRDFDNHFNAYHWTDKAEARELVNQALELVARRADADELGPLVFSLCDLLPETERSEIDDSVLAG
ncbi:Hsp70 family protein [Shewanella sp. 1CM18E]|uniref:Hsp70 family protein n=1 Tax=Shewanella sp. 1CM18E TaxID=2929169 RepID=UPI0020C06082|nr:Hsp70 family protein [Shewanella sp. 1CM18E]MCK8043773.1 Hsp70 family protein [Shewanella sp. 1CM18E]